MVDGFAARLAAYFTFTTKGLRHFLVTGGSAFAAEAVIASGFVPLEHRGQQPSLDAYCPLVLSLAGTPADCDLLITRR